jgi:hypothetical protein
MEQSLHSSEPYVVFVCQDEDQRDQFLHAADYELTGHHDYLNYEHDRFVGRNRLAFVVEHDMHAGCLDAWRSPKFSRDHPLRDRHPDVRSLALNIGSS